MSLNASDFKTNVTLKQVANFFNISVSNVTNQSEVTQEHLFDLYEAYRTKEKEQLMSYQTAAYFVGSLIIISNLTVVISSGLILRKGQQPKSTYLLLGNVSLADTLVGFSIIFGAVVDNSKSSNLLCIFQIGMIVCAAMVSIFSVGLIAVDRYFYILHGLYYQRWFNTTRVRIGIICIWMIGIFVASLPAMGWTGGTFTNYRCWYIAVFPPSLLILVSIIVLSVIIMVCVLYFHILHRAVKTIDQIREFQDSHKIAYINKAFEEERNKINAISKTTVTITVSTEIITEQSDAIELHELNRVTLDENHINNRFKHKILKISQYYCGAKSLTCKLKAVKTVIILTACFVGTWAPYYVAIIMYVNCDIMKNGYNCIPLEMLTLGPLYLLGVSNSLCDPLIYAWRHSGFKRTLRKMYWKFVRKMTM